MNLPVTMRGLFTAALLLMGSLSIPALAQTNMKNTPAKEPSPAMQKLIDEMSQRTGAMVLDYWVPKLNAYKVRIDNALSPAERDRLNELRVRWAILMAESSRNSTKMGVHDDNEDVEISLDLATDKINEVMEIFMGAKEIASRNNEALSPLQEIVIGDFSTFAHTMIEQMNRFADEHYSEIAADPQGSAFLAKRDDIRKSLDPLSSEETRQGLAMAYPFAIEPIVMLYDGAELRDLLRQAGAFGTGTTGLTLPASGVLKQNFPNPASRTTTIAYTLVEPSSRTMLRIYDAKGTLVHSVDEGSRGEGEHSVSVDVSKLSSGSYLYHLTIQTRQGEQVFSKTMQVVQ